MSVSDDVMEVELGGMELDWKAVARLQPCWVKRFRMEAWGRVWSENLVYRIERLTDSLDGLFT